MLSGSNRHWVWRSPTPLGLAKSRTVSQYETGLLSLDLRLEFRKFACKIYFSVCGSAENRVRGCVAIAPSASGMEPTSAATWKPFRPGVALSKKIIDLGLGRFESMSRIAETARVSDGVVLNQREEAE
jgi:hypothetical protein